MIFTLTDRNYNILDVYDTDDYLIGVYTGYIIKSLDINIEIDDNRASNWDQGNYIFCRDKKGYDYWFTIRVVEDGATKSVKRLQCYSGTLDILNEDSNPIVRPAEAQPFKYYFDKIFHDTGISIGVNEIESLTRRLEFTSENARNVEMLQYVLNAFDNAEADLVVTLKNAVPTTVQLNVFRRIGKEEPQTLLTDEDDTLTELNRSGDITDLATCLNPIGVDEEGDDLTLVGKYYEEKDSDGNILYYSPKESPRIFSKKAREQFFVQMPGKENGEFDGYINRRYRSEATTQDALWTSGLTQLKKIDHPIIEYEASGDIDCEPGDAVQIISTKMKPAVRVNARVIEYKFNEDDPSRNEYLFGNYQELESNIDEFSRLIEELRKIVVFVVDQTVEYRLDSQGAVPPTSGWLPEPPAVIKGQWLWARTILTMNNGDQTITYGVSYSGLDGEDGHTPVKGTDYFDGKDGQDGRSSYLHIRYSANSDGSPMTSDPTGAKYTGYATTTTPTAPSTPASYKWQLTRLDGIPGEPGDDGRTSYLHIKYSDDGGVTFTNNGGEVVGSWIGIYVDFTEADSTNVNSYTWNKVEGPKGEDGYTPVKGTDYFDGKDGQDGKSSYLHIRYSANANGTPMDTNPAGAKYTGYATTETPTAPTTPSSYKWQLTRIDGLPGEPGSDGKTSYLHIKYSDDGGATFTAKGGEDVGAWIGTYVDFTQADSTNINSYTWNKVQGDDGKDGTDGDHVFKRYSSNPDGSNMTLQPELDTKYSGDLVVPGTLYENRNILLNSHKVVTLPVKNTGTASDEHNYFAFTPAHMARPLEVGKSYTFIAKIEKTHGTFSGITVYPYPNGKSGFPQIDSEGYIKYDFTVTDPTTENIFVYAGASGATSDNGWRMANQQLIERDIGTSLSELPDTSEGINLVDRTGERENTYINLTGAFVVADNHATMNEVIPVLPGETLIFTKTNSDVVGNPSFWRWRWSDPDGIYISRNADSLNEFKWTVPANTHSIQVSYPVDSNPKIVRNGKYWRQAPEDFINDNTRYSWTLLKGEADRSFKRYSANANGNPMTETPQTNTKYVGDLIVPGYLYENQNLMVASTLEVGKYIEHSTGAVLSANGYQASDFIKVKPNTTIIITADLLWQIRIVEYNANKSRVDGSLYAADQGKYKVFKTKSTTEYLRFSGNYDSGSSLSTWMVQYGTVFTGYQPAPEDLINDYTKYKWSLFKGADGTDGTPGQNAITGYLTNEALVVFASPTGVVSSWDDANGYFRVMDGNDQANSGVTYSVNNVVGNNVAINSTGYYRINSMTGDFGSAILRAVYKGTTIEKMLIIVKTKMGTPGTNGTNGTNGVGISSTEVRYQASNSGTTTPTGTWSTTIPAVAANQYLWTRTITTYTNSTDSTSYAVGKMGANGANGSDGRGISSTVITYQAGSSGTAAPTGTWVSSPPAVAANQFLWTRTIINYTTGSPSTSYSIGKMGANGATGATGAAGKGVSSSAVTYQASTSGTTTPTGAWTTGIPTVAANQYLWTRTIITYTDSTTTTSYSIGKMGATGATGAKGSTGATGATGNGISSSAVTYVSSTSGTTIPTSGWTTTIPSVVAGRYLWTRTILTFTNGSTSTSYSVGRMGESTGIVAQSTEPTAAQRFVGMLWKNTGTAGGRIQNVTYRWTGAAWEIFLFHAENISATNLAAITANLGNITAGTLSGGGANGGIDLNLNTGTMRTMSTSPSETSTLDIFGGRLISKVAQTGGSIYTEAIVGDASVSLRTIDSGTMLHSTTLIPQGFTNYADGATRLISFSREGMILQPSTANVGNDKNSGLELKGVISYIDFHNSPTSTSDFGARIVFGHPTYGPNRLVLLAPNDDVQIQTLGHLHVKNVAGTGYRSVKATSFDSQSAYSVKKDFQQINNDYLLNEIMSTEILSYLYKDAEDETRTIGFVINDGGSPFKTSELLTNADGRSFSLTTAVGMAFGAIKALNKRLEELENVTI